MQTLPLTLRPGPRRVDEAKSITGVAQIGEERTVYEFPSRPGSNARWESLSSQSMAGGFFKGLPCETISDFESVAERSNCPGMTVLITEEEMPGKVFFLVKGKVKLSINSVDGKRFILGMVGPGEVVGLSSAVSGFPYEMTAESQMECKILSLQRKDFLTFLARYPGIWQNVARQLSLQNRHAYEQLHMLGFTLTAPAKLARLLLDWCAEGERASLGSRIQCPYTHGEIGEHIGVSRETVTRCLMDFTTKGLLERRGMTFIVPSQSALAIYAGIDSISGPPLSAA